MSVVHEGVVLVEGNEEVLVVVTEVGKGGLDVGFGVEADKIDAALTGYAPSNNRSQFEQTACNRLIVDAYNANPTSMAAARPSSSC